MITTVQVPLDQRLNTIADAIGVPHQHTGARGAAVLISLDIPTDVVLHTPVMVGKDGDLIQSGQYPRLKIGTETYYKSLYEGGEYDIVYEGGTQTTIPLRVAVIQLGIQDRVAEIITARLTAGSDDIAMSWDLIAERIALDQSLIDDAIRGIPDEIARQDAEHQAAAEKREQERREQAEQDRLKSEEKARQDAETQAKIDAEESTIAAWIEQHGSEALKLGHAKGYACRKRYVQEWGIAELGADYALDYNETVTTKTRSCPSAAALNEQVRIENLQNPAIERVGVKWLPENLYQLDADYDEEDYNPDPVEAVEVCAQGVYYYRIYP